MGEGSARPIVLVGQLDNCMFNEGDEKKNTAIGAYREPLPFQYGTSPLTEKMI